MKVPLLRHRDDLFGKCFFGGGVEVYTGKICYVDPSTMLNASLPDIYHVMSLYITAQWSTGIKRVFPPVAYWQKMLDQMPEVSAMSGWYTQYVLFNSIYMMHICLLNMYAMIITYLTPKTYCISVTLQIKAPHQLSKPNVVFWVFFFLSFHFPLS